MIRVRIAPSPTGYAHVGTAYTALFNYAFAKHTSGKFIIRIEDSDLKRNIEGAEQKIYEALDWLGISWDEGTTKGGGYGPYKLSERLTLYKQKAKELLEKGLAYEDEGAIRFKNPKETVSWNDLVRGEISFPGEEITDFVMMKSDGYPTYNFNVVVDDIAMEITHVIRGEDHISNTPRQIALYKAFGAKVPEFAHHPMLLNNKKQKLSKRDASVDVMEYKGMGILPEAFINFLSLMGWSHPTEKEIFDIHEFTKEFTLERVRKSGAIFDMNKLLWMNQQYIQQAEISNLKSQITNFFDNKYDEAKIGEIVPLINTRIKTLKEFESIAGFFFSEPEVNSNLYEENYKDHIGSSLSRLENLNDWTKEKIDEALMAEVTKKGYHTGKFFMHMRIAITGSKVTPPMSESLVILGKEETVKRLQKALI